MLQKVIQNGISTPGNVSLNTFIDTQAVVNMLSSSFVQFSNLENFRINVCSDLTNTTLILVEYNNGCSRLVYLQNNFSEQYYYNSCFMQLKDLRMHKWLEISAIRTLKNSKTFLLWNFIVLVFLLNIYARGVLFKRFRNAMVQPMRTYYGKSSTSVYFLIGKKLEQFTSVHH